MPAEQQDRRPNWIRTLASRSQPPMPTPAANPFEDAMGQYGELREYAMRAGDVYKRQP